MIQTQPYATDWEVGRSYCRDGTTRVYHCEADEHDGLWLVNDDGERLSAEIENPGDYREAGY